MASPAEILDATLQAIGNSLSTFANSLKGLDKSLSSTSASALKAQAALLIFTSSLEKAINSLGNQFTKFVQLANPAVVIQFTRAMENFISAIGQVLTPVLVRMTPIVQSLANALVSLDEPSRKLIATFAAGAAIAGVVAAVASALSVVTAILGGWVTALVAVGSAIAGAVVMSDNFKGVMDSLKSVLAVVGTVFQAVAKPVSAILETLAGHLLKLVEALAPVQQAFGELLGALVGLIGEQIKGFVAILSTFIPVFNIVSKLLSVVVRVFTTLVEVVSKLVGGLVQKLVELLVGPLVKALEEVVKAVSFVVDKMIELINRLRKMIGLDPLESGKFDPEKNRAQAVVKNSTISDVQSFLNRAYTLSATAGNAAAQNIPKQQLDKLDQINDKMGKFAEDVGKALGAALKGQNGGKLPPAPNAVAVPIQPPKVPHPLADPPWFLPPNVRENWRKGFGG